MQSLNGEQYKDTQRCLIWLMAIYRAEYGKDPSNSEVEKMRLIVENIPQESYKKNRNIVIDLALTKIYEGSASGNKVIASKVQRELAETQTLISKTLEYHNQAGKGFCIWRKTGNSPIEKAMRNQSKTRKNKRFIRKRFSQLPREPARKAPKCYSKKVKS